jgi:hypothetical protein
MVDFIFKSKERYKSVILLVTVAFGALTALALLEHGYWGVWEPQFKSIANVQVLVDLCIALGMVLFWMWHDAKKNNLLFWPWLLITLVAGSFGPLLYMMFRKTNT